MDTLLQQKGKINNSYESEPSLASGSSASENNDFKSFDDENAAVTYFLKPSAYDFEENFTHSPDEREQKKDSLSHSNTSAVYVSSQESPFLGFGNSPKLTNDAAALSLSSQPNNSKPSRPESPSKILLGSYCTNALEENSSNAVDMKIYASTSNYNSNSNLLLQGELLNCTEKVNKMLEATEESSLKSLTFNGKIPFQKSIEQLALVNDQTSGAAASGFSNLFRHNESKVITSIPSQHLSDTSLVLNNTKSPDLFADDDDENDNAAHDEGVLIGRINNHHDEGASKGLGSCLESCSWLDEPTTDGRSVNADVAACIMLKKYTQSSQESSRREKELLRRVRECLSGIPPPPSLTLPSQDLMDRVLAQKKDILNFSQRISCCKNINDTTSSEAGNPSLFRPTHAFNEVMKMPWKDILGVRFHGLHYNLNEASEYIEYLSLSVIERFIGAETESSYRYSPSSAKKRNARLKLISQSPGNRLSHLAKRRAMFSSANLASSSQKVLGHQILIDKKKNNKHRRKATPKRKTPGSKKKVRKTPSSSARKKLGPSRETSKRALFQSPVRKSLPHQQLNPPMSLLSKPEIANRVEKSKRALFSSDCSDQSQLKSISSDLSSNSLETLLKRKRVSDYDDDYLDNTQTTKMLRGDAKGLTPRALKIKSQSFCAGAGSFSKANYSMTSGQYSRITSQTDLQTSFKTSFSELKFQRAQSETIAQSVSLTDNQKKKLLWAVSQALQEKKITSQHDNFKQYASVLARVVRRIFQEFYHSRSTSNSETMLRLSKKYVYQVMAGKTADEIYLQAKLEIEESKSASMNRLSGYIDREEYTRLKLSQQAKASKSSSVGALVNSKSGFSDETSQSKAQFSLSNQLAISTSDLVKAGSLDPVSKEHPYLGSSQPSTSCSIPIQYDRQDEDGGELQEDHQISNYKHTKIQPNSNLENSSSKNNLGDLALRENVHCEQRSQLRSSAQKYLAGKCSQSNTRSPFATVTNEASDAGESNIASGAVRASSITKASPTLLKQSLQQTMYGESAKARRQIIFDI